MYISLLSLQATWIRNTLLRALRDTSEIDTRQTTDNFVYSHLSISQLATFLHSVAQGAYVSNVGSYSRVDSMHAMVLKYSKDLPVMSGKHPDRLILQTEKVVLLTGTTGALGCHILASLVLDQTVRHIYAVNRPGKMSAKERQQQSLTKHGIVINTEKVTLLEADLSSKHQLFSPEVRTSESLTHCTIIRIYPIQVTNSVTHIIHNGKRFC